jgi:hypothetical protein
VADRALWLLAVMLLLAAITVMALFVKELDDGEPTQWDDPDEMP